MVYVETGASLQVHAATFWDWATVKDDEGVEVSSTSGRMYEERLQARFKNNNNK